MRFSRIGGLAFGVVTVAVLVLGYRASVSAAPQVILTPYGSNHPQRGDIVAVQFPTEPASFTLRRIDAIPGEPITLEGRSDIVPAGRYYSRVEGGKVVWSLIPEAF